MEFTIDENRMTLEEIAEVFDLSIVALKDYNPQLINTYLPRGTYQLNLPVDKYDKYMDVVNKQKMNDNSDSDSSQNKNIDDMTLSNLPSAE